MTQVTIDVPAAQICPVCNSAPCKLTGGTMGEERSLTVDDWREIHHLWLVFLHDMHAIIHRARSRDERE